MKLTHINESGQAHMVDTSDRSITIRIAKASGKVLMSKEVLQAIADKTASKGDVLATARIAGIMGAKKTSELIPLCHQIQINKVVIDFEIEPDGVKISAEVKTTDRTGVEMEALTAVSIAALTLIDMIKAADPRACIAFTQMDSKSGGKNGDWTR